MDKEKLMRLYLCCFGMVNKFILSFAVPLFFLISPVGAAKHAE